MTEPLPVELPPTVVILAKLIGLTAVLKLVEKYGGTKFYVPSPMPPDHPLVTLIGAEMAEQLRAAHSREAIWLPRCVKLLRAERDRLIRTWNSEGKGAGRIALELHITERHVFRVLKQNPIVDSRQILLFRA